MSKLYVNTILPQSGNDVVLSGNLDVSGTLKAYQIETITYAATTYLGDTTFGNNNTDSHTFNGTVSGSGRGIFTGGVLTEGTVTATGSLLTSHNVSGSGKGFFVGGIETAGNLSVSGTITFGDSLSGTDISGSGKGFFVGGVEAQGDLQTSGSLYARHNVSGSGKGLFAGGVEAQGDLQTSGSLYARHNVSGSGKGFFVGGIETAGTIFATGSIFRTGQVSGSGGGIFTVGIETGGDMNTSGSLYARHNVSGSGKGFFVGGIETAGNLSITGSVSSGASLTLDAGTDINFDADGGDVFFKDGGVQQGVLKMDTASKFILSSSVSMNDFHLISGRDIVLDPGGSDILPPSDNTVNLGSSSKRWANVYTADLHLKNDKGDWTILEEENYLCVVNNKTKKRYKMMLEEIE